MSSIHEEEIWWTLGLLLGGGIRHVTAALQFMRGSKEIPACVRNIFKRVYFRQYFACLRERIFNCCIITVKFAIE